MNFIFNPSSKKITETSRSIPVKLGKRTIDITIPLGKGRMMCSIVPLDKPVDSYHRWEENLVIPIDRMNARKNVYLIVSILETIYEDVEFKKWRENLQICEILEK